MIFCDVLVAVVHDDELLLLLLLLLSVVVAVVLVGSRSGSRLIAVYRRTNSGKSADGMQCMFETVRLRPLWVETPNSLGAFVSPLPAHADKSRRYGRTVSTTTGRSR